MFNRFTRPTRAALDRYRSERDVLLRATRIIHEAHGDAGVTRDLLDRARQRQRGVLRARKAIGFAATVPVSGLGTMEGRP